MEKIFNISQKIIHMSEPQIRCTLALMSLEFFPSSAELHLLPKSCNHRSRRKSLFWSNHSPIASKIHAPSESTWARKSRANSMRLIWGSRSPLKLPISPGSVSLVSQVIIRFPKIPRSRQSAMVLCDCEHRDGWFARQKTPGAKCDMWSRWRIKVISISACASGFSRRISAQAWIRSSWVLELRSSTNRKKLITKTN